MNAEAKKKMLGKPAIQELQYKVFEDKKTGKFFIGSLDYRFKRLADLNDFERNELPNFNLHRLLAFTIPGVHDGDFGIITDTKQSVLLDIEGTDYSLDGLVKFIRKCRAIVQSQEYDASKNPLFKDAASIFKLLKENLESNEEYKEKI